MGSSPATCAFPPGGFGGRRKCQRPATIKITTTPAMTATFSVLERVGMGGGFGGSTRAGGWTIPAALPGDGPGQTWAFPPGGGSRGGGTGRSRWILVGPESVKGESKSISVAVPTTTVEGSG